MATTPEVIDSARVRARLESLCSQHATFGDRFDALLSEHGLVAKEFAFEHGIPLATIHRWRRGVIPVGVRDFVAMARGLGVSVESLIG